jgi:hypothetical protein
MNDEDRPFNDEDRAMAKEAALHETDASQKAFYEAIANSDDTTTGIFVGSDSRVAPLTAEQAAERAAANAARFDAECRVRGCPDGGPAHDHRFMDG